MKKKKKLLIGYLLVDKKERKLINFKALILKMMQDKV